MNFGQVAINKVEQATLAVKAATQKVKEVSALVEAGKADPSVLKSAMEDLNSKVKIAESTTKTINGLAGLDGVGKTISWLVILGTLAGGSFFAWKKFTKRSVRTRHCRR